MTVLCCLDRSIGSGIIPLSMRNVLVVKVSPSLSSLIEEVIHVLPSDTSLNCGHLLGACLLDTTSHGVSESVGAWVGRSIPVESVLDAVRHCHRECSEEGPANSCVIGDAIVRSTAWGSFILRFVNTCGPIGIGHELFLFAGLLELEPPSVVAMLAHLGLDGPVLRDLLDDLGVQMTPASDRQEDPHVQEAQHRYFTWLYSSQGETREPSCISGMQSATEMIENMLRWLSEEYENVPLDASFRAGDVVLFELGYIQDLCVLGARDLWRSLTGRASGESIAATKNAVRAFRPRWLQRETKSERRRLF